MFMILNLSYSDSPTWFVFRVKLIFSASLNLEKCKNQGLKLWILIFHSLDSEWKSYISWLISANFNVQILRDVFWSFFFFFFLIYSEFYIQPPWFCVRCLYFISFSIKYNCRATFFCVCVWGGGWFLKWIPKIYVLYFWFSVADFTVWVCHWSC